MKNLYKNKLFIILLLFIIIISTFSSVFADNSIINEDEGLTEVIKNHEFYNQYDYCICVPWNYSQNYAVFFIKHVDGLKIGFDGKSLFSNMDFTCREIGILPDYSINVVYDETVRNFSPSNNGNDGVISFSTISIYDSNFEELLFYRPPQATMALVEVAEQATEEIAPTILKVIAMTVGLVISLIALKKAFQALVIGLKA